MRWRWWFAGHPAVVRAGGVWAILKQARLAFRLLRDERVPTATKLIIPATLLYLISPLDLIPDLIPVVGQVDDVMLLLLGVVAFIKLCPEWLVAEHQGSAPGGGRAGGPRHGVGADRSLVSLGGRPRHSVVARGLARGRRRPRRCPLMATAPVPAAGPPSGQLRDRRIDGQRLIEAHELDLGDRALGNLPGADRQPGGRIDDDLELVRARPH